jgi:hypothetical protein
MAKENKSGIAAFAGTGFDVLLIALDRAGKNTPLLTVALVAVSATCFAYALLLTKWVSKASGFYKVVRGGLMICLVGALSIWFAVWLWPEPLSDFRITSDSKLYPFVDNGRARLRIALYNDNAHELGFHVYYRIFVVPSIPKTIPAQRKEEEKWWKVLIDGGAMGRKHDASELKLAGKNTTWLFLDAGPLSKEQADAMNAKTGAAYFVATIMPSDSDQLPIDYCTTNFGDPEILLSCENHNGPREKP